MADPDLSAARRLHVRRCLRFELSEPLLGALFCHCKRCQRRTGTGVSTTALTAPGSYRTVARRGARGHLGPRRRRLRQGLLLAAAGASSTPTNPENPGILAIRMGALDGDPGIRPGAHQFVDYAAPWAPASRRRPAALPGADRRRRPAAGLLAFLPVSGRGGELGQPPLEQRARRRRGRAPAPGGRLAASRCDRAGAAARPASSAGSGSRRARGRRRSRARPRDPGLGDRDRPVQLDHRRAVSRASSP